jgi:hypothetical protein
MAEEIEIWRSRRSAPALMVSSLGRVMIVPHIGKMPGGGDKHYGGLATLGTLRKDSGRRVYVYGGKNYKIHRLVCEAFNGPAPEAKPYALHIDENPINNRADNLKWGDQKENLAAPGFRARVFHERINRSPQKITDEQAVEIVSRAQRGESQARLAKEFGISACHISNMRLRGARKAVSQFISSDSII